MPFEALSAKARLMVPVGAIESRWLLRMPMGADLGADVLGQAAGHAGSSFLASNSRKAPFSRASATLAR